jgi:Holliday junction resolvase
MQPEAKVGHKIRKFLMDRGVFVFKVHGSGMMMAGLPDLIACVQGRYVGIEVKMPGNKPSERQLYVHNLIRNAGGECIVAYGLDEVRHLVEYDALSPQAVAERAPRTRSGARKEG